MKVYKGTEKQGTYFLLFTIFYNRILLYYKFFHYTAGSCWFLYLLKFFKVCIVFENYLGTFITESFILRGLVLDHITLRKVGLDPVYPTWTNARLP